MGEKKVDRNDLISYGAILLVSGLILLLSRSMKPHATLIMEGDMSISYPVNNSYPTVPYLILAAVVPFVLVTAVYGFTEKESQWNTAKVAYVFVLAFFFNEGITNIMKNVTGRPRPCFFQACGYPVTYQNGSAIFGQFGVVADLNKCTNSKEAVYEAMRSYPSGHSSHTMVDGLYAFVLLAGLIHQAKWLNKTVRKIAIVLLFFVCMSLPVYIGSSRIWDYKHRGEDVVAGYLVGTFATLAAYYITFGWKWVRTKEKEKKTAGDNLPVQTTV